VLALFVGAGCSSSSDNPPAGDCTEKIVVDWTANGCSVEGFSAFTASGTDACPPLTHDGVEQGSTCTGSGPLDCSGSVHFAKLDANATSTLEGLFNCDGAHWAPTFDPSNKVTFDGSGETKHVTVTFAAP